MRATTNETQAFCKEVVVWKRLTHPNILPLLGITTAPFQLISSWVSGGNLLQYVQKHPEADQLKLVSVLFRCDCPMRDPITSCPTSLMASVTCILAM